MVRRHLLLLLLLAGRFCLAAEDVNLNDLQGLLDEALQLNITAKVLPPNDQPVWDVRSSKLTIPGRSIAVKMVGDNVRVDVVLTPYLADKGELVLVAQGQVWLSEAPEEAVKYLATIESLPIALGEKVLFFPLGLEGELSELGETQSFTIQLEIEVLAYKALLEGTSQ
jgi:hypothetical protein